MANNSQNQLIRRDQVDIDAFNTESISAGINLANNMAAYELQCLRGHADNVLKVAFLPNDNALISASLDGTVRLWNTLTGQEIRAFHHPGPVRAAAVHPDGTKAYTGCDDGKNRLWDLKSGKLLQTINAHWAAECSWTYATAVSPDGKLAASGGFDSRITVWTPQNKTIFDFRPTKPVHHQFQHGPIYSLGFAQDSRHLAYGAFDGTIGVLDCTNGQTRTVYVGRNRIYSTQFSSDGNWVIAGGMDTLGDANCDGRLYIIDISNNTTTELRCNLWVNDIAYQPRNNKTVAIALGCSKLESAVCMLFDVEKKTAIASFRTHTNRINGAAFSADGRKLATASKDKTIRIHAIPR